MPDIRLESTFFENIFKVNAETDVIAPSILSELAGHDQNPYFVHRPSRYRVKRNYFITSHRVVRNAATYMVPSSSREFHELRA